MLNKNGYNLSSNLDRRLIESKELLFQKRNPRTVVIQIEAIEA